MKNALAETGEFSHLVIWPSLGDLEIPQLKNDDHMTR
jgi:hypothetical protein